MNPNVLCCERWHCLKKSSFSENPWQRCPNTQNVGKRLSSCHLNKQRLINPLEAEVDESARLIESTGVTPPYKISRFHRESQIWWSFTMWSR